jgi:hypothetical protein
VDYPSHPRTDGRQEILIESKKRLDGLNFTMHILDYEVRVREPLRDRIFDQLVKTMVFAFPDESAVPVLVFWELCTGTHLNHSARHGTG